MLIRILAFFCCVFAVKALGTEVKHILCSGDLAGVGQVIAVRVEPCPPYGDGGCILKKNNSVIIEIEFIPTENSDTLKHVVHGVIFGAPVPYLNLGGPDACGKLVDESCPIEADKTYVYQSNFNVLANYPTLALNVRWQLIAPDGKIQACVSFPVKIDP